VLSVAVFVLATWLLRRGRFEWAALIGFAEVLIHLT
jgi:hypothetical protein